MYTVTNMEEINALRELGFTIGGVKSPCRIPKDFTPVSTVTASVAEHQPQDQTIVEMVPMTVDGLEISEEDILAVRTSRVANPILRDIVDFTKKHMSEAQVSDIRNIFTPMILKMQDQLLTSPEFVSFGQVILGQFVGIINAQSDEEAEHVLQSLKDYVASSLEVVEQ